MPRIISTIVDVYVFRRLPQSPVRGGVEFLLLQRAGDTRLGGTWQSVHGKIEQGETASKAALRELHEETGLRPIRFWHIDYVNTFYMAAEEAIQMCPCFAAEAPADAAVRLNAEHTAHRWLAPEDASVQFMWPGQRQAVREILDEIVALGLAEPHLRIEVP